MSDRRVARPRKAAWPRYYDSDLHALLVKTLPAEYVLVGRVNSQKLAKALDLVAMTVRYWMLRERVSAAGAEGLIRLSDGALTAEALRPFLAD